MILSKQQQLGLFGEEWCLSNLFNGFDCYCPVNFNYGYDFLLEGVMPVEIKTSSEITKKRAGRIRTRYAFDIGDVFHPHGLTILLCLNSDIFPFIVPNWFIAYRTHIEITSHPTVYQGWLKPFLWNISQISMTLNICKKYDNRFLQLL
jgi:hypothetical protein